MTTEELEALFDEYAEEYIRFENVAPERRFSDRPDVHAFVLLDRLLPGKRDLICSSAHDEFFLDVSPEDLAPVVTEAQVIDLIRCGVRNGDYGLCMFA